MTGIIGSEQLRAHSTTIRDALSRHTAKHLAPDTRKSDKPMRRFSVKETAEALRVNYSSLRHYLKTIEGFPAGELEAGNRRTFSGEEVHAIQNRLYEAGKIPLSMYPRKAQGDVTAKLAVYNLKGGVAKTSLSANLAEFLGLRGFRCLIIDLDPQSSLSDLFDVNADAQLDAGDEVIHSIYDVLKYDNPIPITKVIQATYFPNIDIVPGSMNMTEFEYETSASYMNGSQQSQPWHRKISNALRLVEDFYDIILFDTPPHMSFAVIAAVASATGLLVPVSAGMLDVVSLEKFLDLGAGTLEVVESVEKDKTYDFIRFVLTRYNPNDQAQLQLSSFLRSQLGDAMLQADFLQSTAIGDGTNTMQPLLEVGPNGVTRKTYDRIFDSLQKIAHEVEAEVMKSWGRDQKSQGDN